MHVEIMAQPSVALYFNNRKKSAIEETKITHARKVLVLDSGKINSAEDGLGDVIIDKDVAFAKNKLDKLQSKEEKSVANKIVSVSVSEPRTTKAQKIVRNSKQKKLQDATNQKTIQELISNMNRKDSVQQTQETVVENDIEREQHVTPPNTPSKKINAMDKVKDKINGPSLNEIKRKMTRSARLADLKASISKYQEGASKLKKIEKETSQIPESPKLRNFKTIELQVQTSPQKVFSPEKAYLSPKKDSSARRNLIHLLSPTKNAVAAVPVSSSKQILEDTAKPALTLPVKYRFLAEIFRCIDTISQILHNRKETITFRKLKPAVEEMLKRNISEKHIAQIKHIYPEAFKLSQEKLHVFGTGTKKEQWELVITPNIGDHANVTSDVLLQRRRKLFNALLDKVKSYHEEFLMSLNPPIHIPKDKLTRWHPLFTINLVPDIELAEVPQPPVEEKFTTGKDVLEKAKEMFNCNTRMEQALQRLKERRESSSQQVEEKPAEIQAPQLKGIPKALLEKIRQKQAAKALVSMTRSADKEKEVQMYSRLPELTRLTRNLFVSEKKGVLPLEVVVEKLGNCYRTFLTKTEMEEHLKLIAREAPGWLVFHNIRNTEYIKLAKNADVSVVINKMESLVKEKSEI